MVASIVLVWILALCTFCQAQEFRNGKVIGVSEGKKVTLCSRTCEPLQNPEHGQYFCQTKDGQERCKLKCNAGYIVPITYTPLNVLTDVAQRGIYVCKEVPGGVTWAPPLIFDCVEKRDPTKLMLHYGIDFHQPCDATTDLNGIRSTLLPKLRASQIKASARTHMVTFTVDIFLECVKTLVGDMELAFPFTEENTDKFPDIRTNMDNVITKQVIKTALKLNAQTKTTTVNKSGFFTDCPRGTRLESDFTCRGCSKGYFLDLSRSECAPCPPGTYQDETLRAFCKTCPVQASKRKDGLRNRKQCFYSGNCKYGGERIARSTSEKKNLTFQIVRKHTSFKTMTWALSSLVIVGNIIIFFRGTVTTEVTPETAEMELLEYEIEDDDVVLDEENELAARIRKSKKLGKKEGGSGDFDVITTRPARKVNEEIENMKRTLATANLPLEPKPKTAEARKSLARERMRMTMTANAMKRSGQLRKSQVPAASVFTQQSEEQEFEEEAGPQHARQSQYGRQSQHVRQSQHARQSQYARQSMFPQRRTLADPRMESGWENESASRRYGSEFSDVASDPQNMPPARMTHPRIGSMGRLERSGSVGSLSNSSPDDDMNYQG